MTKKEFCLQNEPIAAHDYYRMQIHGIEYGVEDYVYLSRIYQKTCCGATFAMFHKLKIYYDAGGNPYIKVNGRKFDGRRETLTLWLEHFIRVDNPNWVVTTISCDELKTIC